MENKEKSRFALLHFLLFTFYFPARLHLTLLMAGGLLFFSCSQKKNMLTSRIYHNLTAHYNGLYWANVSLEEGVAALETAHKDDYGKILQVFRYADEKTAKANYPKFDRAIEKTNKVIQYHSMLINGKEYNRWIDENYMTLGKAHFYKRDYYAAVEVFEYVVKIFSDNPVKYDAFLWLVRCYNQMNSVIKTGPILDLLKHDKHLPKHLLDDYYSVLSDYHIRTEQYNKAKESLEKAILLEKKKTVKGRFFFILAQLCEQEGDLKKATEYYSQCARLHPSYEMEFNARLAKVRTFHIDNHTDTRQLKDELHKMLKDEKNRDYQDQIFYAIGDIAFREGDIPSALKHFKLSAQSSMSNVRQKAVSYLRIAEIYFDNKEYKFAQAYYDSTIAFLPKDYKNYEQIKNKKESLGAMIKNIGIISQEDSLLRLSVMDTASIGKIIDEIIAKLIEEEEKKKQEQEAKAQASAGGSLNQSNNPWDNSSGSGSWYFYNTSMVSFGFAEFFKTWGNRPLEDNWRRSNKEVVMEVQEEEAAVSDTSGQAKIAPNKTREYYLKNIPFTEEQKTKSHEKIVDAYYALGGIYKEDLQDKPKAAETFEELFQRYPDNKYLLNLYYQLYRLYLAMNNQGKAESYKNKILNEHPNSEYAKIILNPEYQKALRASQNEIEKFYKETFSAYYESRYGDVIAMANKADSFYSASSLMPKFALLRAYSIARTNGAEDYERALQGIIAKYPKGGDTKTKAQELLDHLKKIRTVPIDIGIDSAALKDTAVYKSPYTFKDSATHQCVIILPAKKVNLSEFLIRISNFNSEYFRLITLSTNTLLLDEEHHLVCVKSFPLSSKAKDYYDLIYQDNKVFKGLLLQEYQVFPISDENFVIFYAQKKVDEYQRFFSENYFKNEE